MVHINVEQARGFLFERDVSLPGTIVEDFDTFLSELAAIPAGEKNPALDQVRGFWNLDREEGMDEAWSTLL